MGPDEESTSKYSMVMKLINEDGTYGEPIKWSGFKPITEEPESTIVGYARIPREDFFGISGEIHIVLRHAKISKKTFKKWCMSRGLSRNDSELACQIIGFRRGKLSYQKVYLSNVFAPRSYLYIEGERTHG